MKLRLPWQKEKAAAATAVATADPAACEHPRVDVEMHGTAIKRRWCAVCGADLPLPERGPVE
jgi:hypothetical protein